MTKIHRVEPTNLGGLLPKLGHHLGQVAEGLTAVFAGIRDYGTIDSELGGQQELAAVDNGNLAPGVFTLVLTDGYSITGSLTSGTIVIQ